MLTKLTLQTSGAQMKVHDIQAWLTTRLSRALSIDADQIDPRAPFALYGVTSMMAIDISRELETWFGRRLSPTLAYDYPCIAALAAHLGDNEAPEPAAEVQPQPVASGPIAIVGISCRFPGARGPAAYWRLLCDGVDAIREVPEQRWPAADYYDRDAMAPGKANTRWGGFLDQIDQFDPWFFGISPREAERMDPQQRLILELAWEALEDAGIVPRKLAGTRTGVFVGASVNEYSGIQLSDLRLVDNFAGTGNALSILANRISYLFDLHGPSITVDTACSSSLVAVHHACKSLQSGESTLALACGVNLILSPAIAIGFAKAGVMAADGRCKAFDAAADGYVRSEGGGVVVLKPLAGALADGDRIYGIVRGSAVNHDGRTNGLLAPSRQAQEAVVRAACRDAGISPADIQYVEAHGTGTSVGDVIEAAALHAVLSTDRPAGAICAIGSVKTNIGHTEAAAGIAGMIKVALAVNHGVIPLQLHFRTPNPSIRFEDTCLRVQTSASPWPATGSPLAGVSSFGFGGSNAHVIIEGPPAAAERRAEPARAYHLLPISARSPQALRELARAHARALAELSSAPGALHDVCFSASVRRGHLEHRLAVVGRSSRDLAELLEGFAAGQLYPGVHAGREAAGQARRLVFVFSGQGPQWWPLARDLLDEPVFRAELDRVELALRRHQPELRLLDHIQHDEAAGVLVDPVLGQPTLFAVQVALAELWRSWGIEPDAVIGHSMGEVAASDIAGALELDAAARVITERGRAIKRASGRGAMALVDLPLPRVRQALDAHPGQLFVAAHNGPESVVISGQPEALAELVSRLSLDGVTVRTLEAVDYASHSPFMEPVSEQLATALANLQPRPARLTMVSTVTAEPIAGDALDASYWGRNLREPVRLFEAIEQLAAEATPVFVEIGPHPVLTRAVAQTLAHLGVRGEAVASLQRGDDGVATLLGSLAALYAQGHAVRWDGVYPSGGVPAPLPSYCWQRERFWLGDLVNGANARPARPSGSQPGEGGHPLLQHHTHLMHPEGVHLWEATIDRRIPSWVADHQVYGEVVFPGAGFFEMSLSALEQSGMARRYTASDVALLAALSLDGKEPRHLQVTIAPSAGDHWSLNVFSSPVSKRSLRESWTHHMTATLVRDEIDRSLRPPAWASIDEIEQRCSESIAPQAFYQRLWDRGLQLGATFRGVKQIWRREGEALARIEIPEISHDELAAYRIHPAVLDACLQVLSATQVASDALDMFVPVGCKRIQLFEPGPALWSHVMRHGALDHSAIAFEVDVRLLDDSGRVIAELEGVRLQRIARGALQIDHRKRDTWLYETAWRTHRRLDDVVEPAGAAEQSGDRWLVFADRGGVGLGLVSLLENRGYCCVTVFAGGARQVAANGRDITTPPGRELIHPLILEQIKSGDTRWRGIVYLWGLDAADPDHADALETSLDICDPVLGVVSGLVESGAYPPPRLWLVTRGAQPVGAAAGSLAIAQSPLWGLANVIALEHPEQRCSRIDLDPAAGPGDAVQLAGLLGSADAEDQIAVRDGTAHVPRVVPYVTGRSRRQPSSLRDISAVVRPDAIYAITGGLGGLGLVVAQWMASQGARQLVLIGRSPPSSTAENVIAALRRDGVEVTTAQADVTDRDAMAELLRALSSQAHPLRGIVHAAGILDDGALVAFDRARMRRVMAPKIAGAWNLHRLTRDAALDFFVLFSSAVSVLGSPGQGNYSAANVFLDALAHLRRAQGVPALSINWGPWAEVGLAAAAAGKVRARGLVAARFVRMLSPSSGTETLERLMREDIAQVMALPYDLCNMLQFYPLGTGSAMLAEIAGQEPGAVGGVEAGHRTRVRRSEQQVYVEPETATQRTIQGIWERVLAIDGIGTRDSFFELGGDSVLAGQILNQINRTFAVRIDPTACYRSFTIETMAELVESELMQKLDALSEEDALRLLARSPQDRTGP
ncbi:MAG TPA: SDR family NAD(P)-dependent oxidoreductase [Kofleriaceae bacterium]